MYTTETPTFDVAIRLLPAIGSNERRLLWRILGVVKEHAKAPSRTETERFVDVIQATRATGNLHPDVDLLIGLLEGICSTDD